MTLTQHTSKQDLIQTIPLFSDASRRELEELARIADVIDLPAGKRLMREGDRGREFFALLEGTADVTRRGQLLSTLGPGDFFGEIALVSRVPRTATVVTTSPAQALVIAEQSFERMLQLDPDIRLRVLGSLAERMATVTP
jgi:CRP-like cAMP-binding protein